MHQAAGIIICISIGGGGGGQCSIGSSSIIRMTGVGRAVCTSANITSRIRCISS